jgi:predicted metalloendopeptidase
MRLDFCGAEIKMRIVRISLLIILAAICAAQKPVRSGLHIEDMDASCKPCSDFWRYANGSWLDKNPVPADRSAWGPIQILTEANRQRMRTILETATNQRNAAPGMRRLGDYYAACMNTPELDKLGYKPLEGDFARIAAIKTVSELAAAFAYFQKVAEPWGPTDSVAAPFRFLEMSDPENSKQSIAEIEPSALSLEDRNYYLADDERSKRIRAAFLDQVTNLLALAGAPRDSALMQAHSILNLETKLAASELPPADKRDVSKSTHVLGLSDLRMLAPNVNWTLVFRERGLPESTRINVSEPEALKKVGEEMAAEPLENWRTWLRWRDIHLSARYLSKPLVFHFQGTVLSGITQPPPRWRTCARTHSERDEDQHSASAAGAV